MFFCKKDFKLTEEERNELGVKIKQLREDMQLTKVALTDRLGLPKSQRKKIYELEIGKKEPSKNIMLGLADIFQVEVFDIIPKETFNKLNGMTSSIKGPHGVRIVPFDIDTPQLVDTEDLKGLNLDLTIPPALLLEVSKKNVFNIPLSAIICAGLNFYLQYSKYDKLSFVISNYKSSKLEKELVNDIIDSGEHTYGIEVFRTLQERDRKLLGDGE